MKIDFNDFVDDFIRDYCANKDCNTKNEYEKTAAHIAHVIEHFAADIDGGKKEMTKAMRKCEIPSIFPAPPNTIWPKYIQLSDGYGFVILDETGYVIEDRCTWPKNLLLGKHITNLLPIIKTFYLREYHKEVPKGNGIEVALAQHIKEMKEYEQFLNAIVFRIMERNKNAQGPILALDFAIEKGADITIPIRYGIDIKHNNIYNLLGKYCEIGQTLNLECFANYYSNNKEVIPFSLKEGYDLYLKHITDPAHFLSEPFEVTMQKAMTCTIQKQQMQLARKKKEN